MNELTGQTGFCDDRHPDLKTVVGSAVNLIALSKAVRKRAANFKHSCFSRVQRFLLEHLFQNAILFAQGAHAVALHLAFGKTLLSSSFWAIREDLERR